MKLRPLGLHVALAAVVLASACGDRNSPTALSDTGTPLSPRLSLIPSPADGTARPINRIQATTRRMSDGSVLADQNFDVSPTAAEWVLDLSIPRQVGEVVVIVTVVLIHVDEEGIAEVQFSGLTDPVSIVPGRQAVPDVPLVRGPTDNLFTTGVGITAVPATLVEGQSVSVTASATTSQPALPLIFWTSLNPTVLGVDGRRVTALVPGSALLVASAGAYADTALVVVLPADSVAPTVLATFPASGAVDVSQVPRITVRFDEAMAAATLTPSTFVLRDSLGATVPGSVTYQDSVATFAPTSALDSLHSYMVEVTTGVRDLAGNALVAPVTWGFRTGRGAVLLRSIDPVALGSLVAIAFDDRSGNLLVYDDFTTVIHEVTQAGAIVAPEIPHPGIASNDIDLDFLPVTTSIGGTVVSANTLLVFDGETLVGELFAIDKDDGTVRSSVSTQVGDQTVGGAFHPGRGTFYGVNWKTNRVVEMDPVTGDSIATFPVAPAGAPGFTMFFGDMEVDPASGNLLIVSSSQPTIRILSPTGVFIRDVSLTPLGISGMSGIAWDVQTATAWITTQNGPIHQVGGIPVG